MLRNRRHKQNITYCLGRYYIKLPVLNCVYAHGQIVRGKKNVRYVFWGVGAVILLSEIYKDGEVWLIRDPRRKRI